MQHILHTSVHSVPYQQPSHRIDAVAHGRLGKMIGESMKAFYILMHFPRFHEESHLELFAGKMKELYTGVNSRRDVQFVVSNWHEPIDTPRNFRPIEHCFEITKSGEISASYVYAPEMDPHAPAAEGVRAMTIDESLTHLNHLLSLNEWTVDRK